MFALGGYRFRRACDRAPQFVAVGIAKVGEIHLPGGPLAHARRVLDRLAAIRDAGIVPCVDLFRAAHRKADRTAIGMAAGLPSMGLDTMKRPPLCA